MVSAALRPSPVVLIAGGEGGAGRPGLYCLDAASYPVGRLTISTSPSLFGGTAVDRLEDKLAGYELATRADLLGCSQKSRGVRHSHRAGGQHRRDRLPDTPPRPAGVAPANPNRNPCKPELP